MAKLVAKRYAVAFYDLAKEENALDKWYEELSVIVKSFYDEKEFMTMMASPQLNTQEKKDLVKNILEGKADNSVLNLIELLIDKGRFGIFDDVFAEFEVLYLEEKNILHAKAYSVVPLTEDKLTQLKNVLENKLNKKIEIENEIQKDLVGGVMLKIGDKIIDGSIKRRLELLRDELLTAKH
ncbi:MAG: F0F1 ATP synthase subunit delta [Tissierellales bacterium]|jgi:F-type H+-transporting ATPase subunit delta|nr:F0F1 ATP synthase subunit delta [Tissierellales bacterium]